MDLDSLFGSSSHPILWWQMLLRTIVIFIYGVLLVRFAGKRIFGNGSALDLVVAIVAGSNFSRALTANAPLGATLLATTALVGLHWVVARLAARHSALEWLVKGRAEPLIAGGRPHPGVMARHGISRNDLTEALRQSGVHDVGQVAAAYVEPNGRISVIRSG